MYKVLVLQNTYILVVWDVFLGNIKAIKSKLKKKNHVKIPWY